jgi:nucleoside-diphosphate-sugar epimerase
MGQGSLSAARRSVLVSGANGFVGAALCATLQERGRCVVGGVRSGAGVGQVDVGNLNGSTDWGHALSGCETVIHLAARVHVMADHSTDPLSAYREVNVDASLNLARQAKEYGVRRFVFVSSVKVNGEATSGQAFTAADLPCPCDPYGLSKLEAERALREFAASSGLELVIVRPPLVYGPGVKANFANLLRLVRLGVPLPFGRVKNLRSMVAIDNLVDLLIVCAEHPSAPGHTFMVSDGADLSIGELVQMIGRAMGKRIPLIPIPLALLEGSAKLLGKAAMVERLLGSLQVDIGSTRATLGWAPPISPETGIRRTVASFQASELKRKT